MENVRNANSNYAALLRAWGLRGDHISALSPAQREKREKKRRRRKRQTKRDEEKKKRRAFLFAFVVEGKEANKK